MKSKIERKNNKKISAKPENKTVAVNKKAAFDYFFVETFEAGIALEGSEVKSVKKGDVSLRDSFCFRPTRADREDCCCIRLRSHVWRLRRRKKDLLSFPSKCISRVDS